MKNKNTYSKILKLDETRSKSLDYITTGITIVKVFYNEIKLP
jgi:hypothetical protein